MKAAETTAWAIIMPVSLVTSVLKFLLASGPKNHSAPWMSITPKIIPRSPRTLAFRITSFLSAFHWSARMSFDDGGVDEHRQGRNCHGDFNFQGASKTARSSRNSIIEPYSPMFEASTPDRNYATFVMVRECNFVIMFSPIGQGPIRDGA